MSKKDVQPLLTKLASASLILLQEAIYLWWALFSPDFNVY